MNKGNHSLQQDENLREALRQEEAALPQMPADLNDRLMKRLHHERRQRHFAVWPWVAVACVAAVIVVWLLPPKEKGSEAMTGSDELTAQTSSIVDGRDAKNILQETKEIASTIMAQDQRITNPDTRGRRIANSTERKEVANSMERTERIANSTEQVLLAQGKAAEQHKEMAASEEKSTTDLPRTQAKPQQVVLTERDIPISRPENYRYTPEEIALMRRQANEAYVKWMELELEIMNYQYEQVAKQ